MDALSFQSVYGCNVTVSELPEAHLLCAGGLEGRGRAFSEREEVAIRTLKSS